MPGLFLSPVIVERYLASVSASTLAQVFVAPTDLTVVGLVAYVGTAPASTDTVKINVSNSPTSQLVSPAGAANQSVVAYSLWTAANVPTITGTATTSFTTSNSTSVIENTAYALNYPLPGPSGTSGYKTAQSTSQYTQSPVIAPPDMYVYELGALTGPDNTYSDLNGQTQSAALIHAGDVLSFVLTGTVGSAADLQISLFCQKS